MNEQLTVPEQDIIVQNLYEQALSALRYAEGRVIASNEDLTPATEDLSTIAKLKKALTEEKRKYLDPVNEQLKLYRAAFDKFFEPIEQADKVTRQKILTFKQEVERKRLEAEETNRMAQEVARRQAEANGGELTVDTTPVVMPPAAPARVMTDVGNVGTTKTWKFEVADFALLPEEYKLADLVKIGKVVRAGVAVPGVKAWQEESIRVTTR